MKSTKRHSLNFNWVIFIGFIFIGYEYFITMLPGLGFHDVGELQGVVPILQIAHPTGFPSYMICGFLLSQIFIGQDPAWRINFLSLIYTLGSLFLLYLSINLFIRNRLISFLSVAFIAFTLPIWNYAGMADTHSFGRLMLSLILYFLFLARNKFSRNYWRILFLLIGISLGGHLFILYAMPTIFIYTLILLRGNSNQIHKKKEFVIEIIICFLIGLSTYLFLPIRSSLGIQLLDYSLATWSGFFRHVSGSDFQGLMFQGGIPAIFYNVFGGLVSLYKWVGVFGSILAIAGICFGVLKYRTETLVMLSICLSFVLFAANYPTSDGSRYYGWVLLLSSFFIALGCLGAAQLIKIKGSIFAVAAIIILLTSFVIVNNFPLVDKHKNNSAQVYAAEVMQSVEYNAVILTWWHYMTPLRYEQMVLGKRSDITLVTKGPGEWQEYADLYFPDRPVYVVQEEESLSHKYSLISVGPIYKLERKREL